MSYAGPHVDGPPRPASHALASVYVGGLGWAGLATRAALRSAVRGPSFVHECVEWVGMVGMLFAATGALSAATAVVIGPGRRWAFVALLGHAMVWLAFIRLGIR